MLRYVERQGDPSWKKSPYLRRKEDQVNWSYKSYWMECVDRLLDLEDIFDDDEPIGYYKLFEYYFTNKIEEDHQSKFPS